MQSFGNEKCEDTDGYINPYEFAMLRRRHQKVGAVRLMWNGMTDRATVTYPIA